MTKYRVFVPTGWKDNKMKGTKKPVNSVNSWPSGRRRQWGDSGEGRVKTGGGSWPKRKGRASLKVFSSTSRKESGHGNEGEKETEQKSPAAAWGFLAQAECGLSLAGVPWQSPSPLEGPASGQASMQKAPLLCGPGEMPSDLVGFVGLNFLHLFILILKKAFHSSFDTDGNVKSIFYIRGSHFTFLNKI